MLKVKDLHAGTAGKEILKGINLEVKPGEVHAIMGPNGSGKSTLSMVLSGNPAYTVTRGSAEFMGRDLLELPPETRSHLGLFLGFQYPVEIPGVSMVNFMRAAINEKRKFLGLPPMSATDFLRLTREKRAVVELDSKLASRSVNEGFSGGEKKRNEIFQMAMLEPKLSILDETDSGLDVDALRIVADYSHNTLSASARLPEAEHNPYPVQGTHHPYRRTRTGSFHREKRLRPHHTPGRGRRTLRLTTLP